MMLMGLEIRKYDCINDSNSIYFIFVSCLILPGKMARNVLPPYSQTDKLRGVFIGSICALYSIGQVFHQALKQIVLHVVPTPWCVNEADVTVAEARMTFQ